MAFFNNKKKLRQQNFIRFILLFFLGPIGSIVINHTELKPKHFKSRTLAYFVLTLLTCGIYYFVACFANLFFNPKRAYNIGYKKD